MNADINEIAYGIFGEYFRRRRAKFDSVRENLIRARIYVPVERWLSTALFYSLIGAICVLFIYLLMKLMLSLILEVDFSSSFDLLDFMLIPAGILLAFFSVFFGFYCLPNIKAWERRGKIEAFLPYAIGYISSMASIGVIPYEIFKKLSEMEGNYGEVSMEAKQIVRDVELLGLDFITALRNLATVTASQQMRSFLQGAVTTALTGGEMGPYFINAATMYMEERRRKYGDFITMLGLFAEFYVVGLVAAPLLIMVVMSIMCFLGTASLSLLAAIVYIIIPLGSAGFIFLIDLYS
ncbi:MAG: type II secretion system F family protein [Methanophagales archaeon]|nr:type II secretion system F family protein [Methanophagales archaeon]